MSENNSPNSSEQVRVVVRCRPMSKKEYDAGFKNVVNVASTSSSIEIRDPKEPDTAGKMFTFDAVYDFTSSQEQIYLESVKPIVESVMDGFNATIFAYGQTGTGKTYTMEGLPNKKSEKGVVPRSFDQIFHHIRFYDDCQYKVRCSYIEIYQETIKDLLDEDGTKTYELRGNNDNVYIKDLKSYECTSPLEMEGAMNYGNKNRKTGATKMNEQSSRSHAIFMISIEITRSILNMRHVKIGKLNLVDLAGSERQAKSKSVGVRLKEATKINLSLSALGNVISALTKENNDHVPYRDSKLTRILQDSLGGNAKTLMIANIGPACYNYTESLNTLKYANRAKNIKNKPTINEDSSKEEMLRKCEAEVERLRGLLYERQKEKRAKELANVEVKGCRKRSHRSIVQGEIQALREKIDEEERIIYALCERIECFQEWKDDIEMQVGTDVLQFTNQQRRKLNGLQEELARLEMSKNQLTESITKVSDRIVALKDLNIQTANLSKAKINTMHETYNKIVDVRKRTEHICKCLKVERKELREDRARLQKRYKLNKIIINEYIPAKEAKKYMDVHKNDKPIASKFHYNLTSPTFGQPPTDWNSDDAKDQRSKFKDNIIVHTNSLGIKQYIAMENDGPRMIGDDDAKCPDVDANFIRRVSF